MIEKRFEFSLTDEKVVEKIIMDENLHYIHMVFNNGEGMPEHMSNSNIYMTVLRGNLSIKLNEQETHHYTKGKILKIPFGTKMNLGNQDDEVLELIIIKSPSPSYLNQ